VFFQREREREREREKKREFVFTYITRGRWMSNHQEEEWTTCEREKEMTTVTAWEWVTLRRILSFSCKAPRLFCSLETISLGLSSLPLSLSLYIYIYIYLRCCPLYLLYESPLAASTAIYIETFVRTRTLGLGGRTERRGYAWKKSRLQSQSLTKMAALNVGTVL
jgi:hypothetical protein